MDGRTNLEPSGWEVMGKRFNKPAAEPARQPGCIVLGLEASTVCVVHIIV